jgi:hypothetical protein
MVSTDERIKLYKNSSEEHGLDIVLHGFKDYGFVLSIFRGIDSVIKNLAYIDSELDHREGTYDAVAKLKSRCENLILLNFEIEYTLPDFYQTITDVMLTRIASPDGFFCGEDVSPDVQLYGYGSKTSKLHAYGMLTKEEGFLFRAELGDEECIVCLNADPSQGYTTLKSRCESAASTTFSLPVDLTDHFYHCIIYQSANKLFYKRTSKPERVTA